jgi:DNA-binding GntR family transcriptional regulator
LIKDWTTRGFGTNICGDCREVQLENIRLEEESEIQVSEVAIKVGEKFPDLKRRKFVSDLDHVYSQLKQSMMVGEFVPGQKLKLAELAEAFGTSHMPVREALNQLAVVGALETAPRRTPSIPQAGKKRLRDLLALRVNLECEAAQLAMVMDDGSLAKALQSINDRMDTEGNKPNPSIRKYLELNQRFHFRLYEGCDNPDLLNLIELLWMRYGSLLNLISSGGALTFKHSQHNEIIKAVSTRDKELLDAALSIDLTSAAIAIENEIDRSRLEN